MKTILLATDCTKNSAAVLKYAYELCKALKSEFVVLHVYDLPPIANTIFRIPEKLKHFTHLEKQEVLDNYCSEYIEQEKGTKLVKTVVTYNESVSEGILLKSKEFKAGLTVVGMKDQHTQRGYFSGNIANAILNKISCPLLILPHEILYKKPNRMMYATDFAADDNLAIKKLVKLAKPFEAKIEVVHIAEKGASTADRQIEEFKEMLQKQFAYRHIHFNLIQAATVNEGLRSFADHEKVDLITLFEREGRSFFGKLFHKDTVKELESHINIPLLSINKKSLSQ